ncbi:mannitol dehydrogenase family protein [Polaromonas sp. JS666]|uniref:mannitol dehydrogenase family protein n=1 Tax=Polaromonas sp. (strain JS666 / ATCC BAA-500) TaxID=296591 RepID=UPI0000464C9D|nr:mannitol dehydrogenase family protein [Polaromonas sp. JS666]ABE45864.1 Mannitol dehydrogenase-like protein [Polaromonas sp. JS666]
MQPLNQATLTQLTDSALATPSPVQLPRYRRTDARVGVVHLGLGAFHRAHQAMVFDALLQRGDPRWGVLGVAMRTTELADALTAQDGLYAVQVASREALRWQVVGSVLQACVAAREPAQVVAAMAAPGTRWVTLTVTEKGYGPALAALLVQGLAARRAAGLGGLTIASCDNLSDNGRKLQQLCVDAAQHDAALAQWIDTACAFPNSMVDRIVPAATAQHRSDAAQALGLADACALGTEEFWEWVIERRFVDDADGDALAAVGVQVVADVKPFEEAKLRMLNGSHTAIALIGAVLGVPTVADCIARPDIHRFVRSLMTEVVMPHLQRPGLPAYRDALLARFANPELRHKVHQIATDSSLKIPLRWQATVLAQLAANGSIEPLALAAAVWMRYLLGADEQGQAYAISDPLGQALQATAQRRRDDVAGTVRALLAVSSIWGEVLPHDVRWTARVEHWLQVIRRQGVAAALAQLHPSD